MAKELDEATTLREAVVKLGRRSRTQAIPRPIRARVTEYARRGRAKGRSWREMAQAVGLSAYTVQRWVERAQETAPGAQKMVPVRVEVDPESGPGGLVLITPSGMRLEGLAREDAVAVLRALE